MEKRRDAVSTFRLALKDTPVQIGTPPFVDAPIHVSAHRIHFLILTMVRRGIHACHPTRFGIDGGNADDAASQGGSIFFHPRRGNHLHPLHVLGIEGCEVIHQLLSLQLQLASVQIDLRHVASIHLYRRGSCQGSRCHLQYGVHVHLLIKWILIDFRHISLGVVSNRIGGHHHFIQQFGILVQSQRRQTDVALHFDRSCIGGISHKRDFKGIVSFGYGQGKRAVGSGGYTDKLVGLLAILQYHMSTRQRAIGFGLYSSTYGIMVLGMARQREQEHHDSHQHDW